MNELENTIRRIIGAMLSEVPFPRRGLVSSVNPATMQAKVRLPSLTDPSGFQLTGWLPIATPCMGGGWGVMAAPPVGAQVIVMPMESDGDSAVVWGAHWSQTQQPPSGYTVGEVWLAHETGAVIKVANSGAAVMGDKTGAWLQADGTGQVGLASTAGGQVALLSDKTVYIQDGNGSYIFVGGAGTTYLKGNLVVSGTITQGTPGPTPPSPPPAPPDVPSV